MATGLASSPREGRCRPVLVPVFFTPAMELLLRPSLDNPVSSSALI